MHLLFAWKYFKSKKSTNAVNIIAWISVVAIAVGAAALILVLSVFNGFEHLVKGLYGDFYADATIIPAKGKTLTLNQAQWTTLQQSNDIVAMSSIVEEKALLVNGDYQSTVVLRGVDAQYDKVNALVKHIIRGAFATGTKDKPSIVAGAGIENATGIDPEQGIAAAVIYLPNKSNISNTALQNAFNSFNIHAAGTFMVQQEFDNKYAFTNIAFMRFMLDMPDSACSSIELKLKANNDKAAATIANALEKQLGKQVLVQTRYAQNQSLYNVMRMEKWFIYGILSLILAVAAFNIIGALTMLVLEKQKDIAVLKAMGASNLSIQQIFLTTGIVLAIVGASIGIGIATIICWLQLNYQLLKLGGNTFIIDYYPVAMDWRDYVLVFATIFVIAFLAAIIPARKASRQQFSLKS